MISYRATLDVPRRTLQTITRWLTAHRRALDLRPRQRAATAREQALLVLRWFRDDTDVKVLARDARISIATAYRYLHEAIDVIAERHPDLGEVLERGIREGWPNGCLDGTLIESDRATTPSTTGHDQWYSGKHHQHGANVQVLTGPTGYPEWISAAEPGSTHDITAAREHVLPSLYWAAAQGLPTLTDKGYAGAGIGVLSPIKGKDLDPDDRCHNQLLSHLRAPAERANALLTQTWRALQHVTLDPSRISDITAATLVLLHLQRPTPTKPW